MEHGTSNSNVSDSNVSNANSPVSGGNGVPDLVQEF
jgi:hypothetical protein